jgi:hypothetical protein
MPNRPFRGLLHSEKHKRILGRAPRIEPNHFTARGKFLAIYLSVALACDANEGSHVSDLMLSFVGLRGLDDTYQHFAV